MEVGGELETWRHAPGERRLRRAHVGDGTSVQSVRPSPHHCTASRALVAGRDTSSPAGQPMMEGVRAGSGMTRLAHGVIQARRPWPPHVPAVLAIFTRI